MQNLTAAGSLEIDLNFDGILDTATFTGDIVNISMSSSGGGDVTYSFNQAGIHDRYTPFTSPAFGGSRNDNPWAPWENGSGDLRVDTTRLDFSRDLNGDGILDIVAYGSYEGEFQYTPEDYEDSSSGEGFQVILLTEGGSEYLGWWYSEARYQEGSFGAPGAYDTSDLAGFADLDSDGSYEIYERFEETENGSSVFSLVLKSEFNDSMGLKDQILYSDLLIPTSTSGITGQELTFKSGSELALSDLEAAIARLDEQSELDLRATLARQDWAEVNEDTGGYVVDYDEMLAFLDAGGSVSAEVTTATTDAQLATALIGSERNEAEDKNGLKEAGAVHLGNGIYLTESRFRVEEDGTGLSTDHTFIHGAGTDNEQAAFVVSETTHDRNVRDLDRTGADEIAMINTETDAGSQIGMVVYADPNQAQGDFTTIGYSRSDDGSTMREFDLTISAGSHQDVTLKNRDAANDVWVTDGLPIPTDMLGGFQGSGVFQEVDGQQYLAGILVGPYQATTDQAFVVDAVGDNYNALANQMLRFGEADDYATNLLIASEDGGRLRGSGLNEVLQGGSGNDNLQGRDGDDRLIDGAGADRLRGGEGEDVFVFLDDGEYDRLLDFNTAEDLIDISDFDVTYADLVFQDLSNNRVRLDIGDDRFLIRDGDGTVDLVAADLTADLFIF